MKKETFGTKLYYIPQVKISLPLRISEQGEGVERVTLDCPFFNEWGQGETFDEALEDLSNTLLDLKALGQKLLAEGKILSIEWQRIMDNITEELR